MFHGSSLWTEYNAAPRPGWEKPHDLPQPHLSSHGIPPGLL